MVLLVVGRDFFLYAPCLGREHFFEFERTKAANLGQLGPTWADLRPLWSNLGLPSANFRQLSVNLGHLGPKWGTGHMKNHCFPWVFVYNLESPPSCNIGVYLDQIGSTWRHLGPVWCQLEAKWGSSGANLGQLGANLVPTWANLGPTRTNLKSIRSQLGANLDILGHLRPS